MSVASVSDRPKRPSDPSSVLQQRRRFSYRNDPGEVRTCLPASPEQQAKTARIVADKSMRLFVEEWDRKIIQTIKSLGMGDHVDDIKQDIYTFICRRNDAGRTGLESYDPAKGSLSSYVYYVIFLKTLNLRNKLARDRLALTPTGVELEVTMPRDLGVRQPLERADFWLQLERVTKDLDDPTSDAEGFFDETGRFVTCDPVTVLRLLLEGRTRLELAKLLRCTPKDIDRICERLRENQELRDLLTQEADFTLSAPVSRRASWSPEPEASSPAPARSPAPAAAPAVTPTLEGPSMDEDMSKNRRTPTRDEVQKRVEHVLAFVHQKGSISTEQAVELLGIDPARRLVARRLLRQMSDGTQSPLAVYGKAANAVWKLRNGVRNGKPSKGAVTKPIAQESAEPALPIASSHSTNGHALPLRIDRRSDRELSTLLLEVLRQRPLTLPEAAEVLEIPDSQAERARALLENLSRAGQAQTAWRCA